VRWNNNIRATLALLQATLLCLILVSGSLFMHKHTTDSGKIVVHVHPYDLSKEGSEPLHHNSDREIHFLDVVFHGQFLQTAFLSLQTHIAYPLALAYCTRRADPDCQACYALPDLRGPPLIFS